DTLFDYYGIRLLAFDVVFSEQDRGIDLDAAEKVLHQVLADGLGPEQGKAALHSLLTGDQVFAESLRNRAVVLGYFFSPQEAEKNPGTIPPPLTREVPAALANHLYRARSYGGNLQGLQDVAAGAGFFNTPFMDDDGTLRRVPLLIQYQGALYESLPVAVLRTLMKGDEIGFDMGMGYGATGGDERLESVRLGELRVPVDAASAVLVPFRSHGQGFRYLSATDVLNGRVPREALSGKILLIGTTAAGLSDLYPTPVSSNYPGVEVHANIISGILDGKLKSRPAYVQGGELIQVLVLGLLTAMLFPWLQAGAMTMALALLCALVIGVNFALWGRMGIDSQLATPLLMLLSIYLVQMFFGYFHESKRKQRLGTLFGQYVPPQLVEEMSRSDEEYSFGGESRKMTVLFCDIRGFTAISERLPPAQLCALINEILTAVTKEIHAAKGTIDKYIGDAVMAFWGAPMPDPDHADHALQAAMAIAEALRPIGDAAMAKGLGSIRMGVGLNTGVMNVGNMGSQFRMAYTVMGDAVNLASRLEGLTKEYGVDIIVSEQTKADAPGFAYRELDRVLVKGRREPVTIYEPLGSADQVAAKDDQELETLAQALAAYRSRRWLEAETLFQALSAAHEGDALYRLYMKRISRFKETPPPPDWAGIHSHEKL
ncbi:MAG: hypothetical protein A2286_06835, partial [Gammaproteobacteria bacterium RIFOXYA12_FULL_61_12]